MSACRLDPAGTGRVAAVVDGRSFRLDDGREIRLAGIEVPFLPRAGGSDSQAGPAQASRAALEALIGGQAVELRQSEAAIDRYGRHIAHAVLGSEGARSAAHEMLARGFAQVGTRVGERACAEELWARERLARAGRLGLWSGPFYAVLAAQSLAELKVDAGQFAIAEGRVWSVRESGATIYMNFGGRWSEALTVTISKRNERTFVAAGLDPKGLKSRRVRVRGFVEARGGTRIEAVRPEQIEIVEPN
jgi:endonuclease YncB( thermonuclease family)